MRYNNTEENTADEIQIEVISTEKLDRMGDEETIQQIISDVIEGKVLILEEGLDSELQGKLVERTMSKIDGENFSGIEIESPQKTTKNKSKGFLSKYLDRSSNEEKQITLIGPNDKMETINKNQEQIQTLIKTK